MHIEAAPLHKGLDPRPHPSLQNVCLRVRYIAACIAVHTAAKRVDRVLQRARNEAVILGRDNTAPSAAAYAFLLVEDEDATAVVSRAAVEEAYIPVVVHRVSNGEQAMEYLRVSQ